MLNNLMIGTAGEYLVAAKMNLHGWHASLTMKNYPMIDIVGYDSTNQRYVSVQVKTIYRDRSFLVGFSRKARGNMQAEVKGPYVVVDLKDLDHPEYYIIPKQDLIDITFTTDDAYYQKKAAKGHTSE